MGDQQPRQPGGSLPEPVRHAAVQAGRRRQLVDPLDRPENATGVTTARSPR
jgi:hypothetical protein